MLRENSRVRRSPHQINQQRLTRYRRPSDDKEFRLTPALENAGYRPPHVVLLREGFTYKITRRVNDTGSID